MEISPLLAIKSWLNIYAKSYVNVTHNSTASKTVLKSSYKVKQNSATSASLLTGASVVYLVFEVTESWFQGSDPVVDRVRYHSTSVSDPSAALSVV